MAEDLPGDLGFCAACVAGWQAVGRDRNIDNDSVACLGLARSI